MTILSSFALAAAIPAYFWLPPAVSETLVVLAVPPHVYVGMTHVISDYLPAWPAEIISFLMATLILFALFKLQMNGTGVLHVIRELWKKK